MCQHLNIESFFLSVCGGEAVGGEIGTVVMGDSFALLSGMLREGVWQV